MVYRRNKKQYKQHFQRGAASSELVESPLTGKEAKKTGTRVSFLYDKTIFSSRYNCCVSIACCWDITADIPRSPSIQHQDIAQIVTMCCLCMRVSARKCFPYLCLSNKIMSTGWYHDLAICAISGHLCMFTDAPLHDQCCTVLACWCLSTYYCNNVLLCAVQPLTPIPSPPGSVSWPFSTMLPPSDSRLPSLPQNTKLGQPRQTAAQEPPAATRTAAMRKATVVEGWSMTSRRGGRCSTTAKA